MENQKLLRIIASAIIGIVGLFVALWLWSILLIAFVDIRALPRAELLTGWTAWRSPVSSGLDNDMVYTMGLIAFIVVFCLQAMFIYKLFNQERTLHGAARFANTKEIEKAGLKAKSGIIVGKYNGNYLLFGGQQFVLLSAPTRSGKGVGIVIPNLLNYADSVVVLDVKQENFNITSGYRAKYGQKIYLFNPFAEDYRSHRYNPLGYVRDGDFRISDLISIGEVLYPSGGRDTFFDDQARNLFVGFGLYLCETPTLPRTIGEMLRQSSGKGRPIEEYIQELIDVRALNDPNDEEPPLTRECVECFQRFINTADNTRTSILATFNAPLGIFANPIVDAATSANDFDLRDVRKKRMSIYIGITPNHLVEAGRLVNLLFSQLININTHELPQDNPALKYQCLLLMDEFTAIGRVGIIAKSVSYMAGYNLRLLTIIQSPSQLEDEIPAGYGKQGAKTLMTNHACQILYAPREQEDAELYSKMLGDETVASKSKSRQAGKGSVSISDQRRALMLPQEIKEIGQWKEIIIMENTKPILCDKIKYFDDHEFLDRLKDVSPSLKALGRKKPSAGEIAAALQKGELSPPVPLLDLKAHRLSIGG